MKGTACLIRETREAAAQLEPARTAPSFSTLTVVAQGQRFCIFCGDTANSREHLLPRWLEKLFPADEPAVAFRQVGGVKRSWETKRFSETTKRVCSGCNHGWLSQLEEVAKPILAPAITRSHNCAFDLRAQWIAAQWAAKTCYVFQSQGPEGLVPQMHPALLRMNGRPAPSVTVFIGAHYRALRDPANCFYMQRSLSLATGQGNDKTVTDEFGYMAWLAVGGVSFLVVGHRTGRYIEMLPGEFAHGAFTKIWPWMSRVVQWPPELLMDPELIEPLFLDSHPPSFEIRIFDLPVHAEMI
ncbi:MAG TPA: hypothetical protein VHF50_00345 [Solirubrobacterales bacterium]|nr:hypothetical protein [Solirubrobacterales bacterium]